LGEHDYLGGTSSEITNNVRVFGGPTLMIPSTLLLQYFHAAQCHLYDLLSSASSSYAASIDKECIDNDNNNDSKNNNLLSYHRNQIVHVQHMALDETIDAWQEKQHEEGMVSNNKSCIVVSRESLLSALRQIGSGDYSSIIYVGGMSAHSKSSNCASIVSSDEEGMLMSLSLVDKNQQQQQQQQCASITTAMEQTNEIARLVYTRMVLSSVATNAATTTSLSSLSSSTISSSRKSDNVKMNKNDNDNSNSKEDDELPLDERTISDYLALTMSAIRLPEVNQYLHHNDGHHDADTSSLLTFLFNTDKKCSQDDGVGLEDTSKQQHNNNEKKQRLQYVQRLCWHAVLGIQSTSVQHECAMNYLQNILDTEFGITLTIVIDHSHTSTKPVMTAAISDAVPEMPPSLHNSKAPALLIIIFRSVCGECSFLLYKLEALLESIIAHKNSHKIDKCDVRGQYTIKKYVRGNA
jgi:hypothetical protein